MAAAGKSEVIEHWVANHAIVFLLLSRLLRKTMDIEFDVGPFSRQSNDARAWSWKHNGKAADFPPKEKNHVFSKNFSATVKDCGIFSPIVYMTARRFVSPEHFSHDGLQNRHVGVKYIVRPNSGRTQGHLGIPANRLEMAGQPPSPEFPSSSF